MTENNHPNPIQPTLSLSFAEVGRIRVRPAELARLLGVSRQTVSQWIQVGKVTLGADGKVDPSVATRQVIDNSDPSRLRARVLKGAVDDAGALRRRIAELERALVDAAARARFLEEFNAAAERHHEFFIELMKARMHQLADPATFLVRLAMMDETAMFCADGIDCNDAADEGGHDPRMLLDRELALDVLSDPRALDENEGGGHEE